MRMEVSTTQSTIQKSRKGSPNTYGSTRFAKGTPASIPMGERSASHR